MPAPKNHKAYNQNGEGGRPKKWTAKEIEQKADELLLWIKEPMNVWFKDFALQHGLHPSFLSEWAKANQRFAVAYELAKSSQESRLVNGGLMNAYNAQITKFCLINCHGWVDRNETKVSGDAVNPLAAILTVIDGASKNLVEDEE